MLKLTTDRHEASHGLFATAELLVLSVHSATDCHEFLNDGSSADGTLS